MEAGPATRDNALEQEVGNVVQTYILFVILVSCTVLAYFPASGGRVTPLLMPHNDSDTGRNCQISDCTNSCDLVEFPGLCIFAITFKARCLDTLR